MTTKAGSRSSNFRGSAIADQERFPERIKLIARESLNIFTRIAESAKSRRIASESTNMHNVLVDPNPWDSASRVRALERIRRENISDCKLLEREPAIARVVAVDENGETSTYYFSRAAPPILDNSEIKLASYRAPVGRLAALTVGEEFPLPRAGNTNHVTVLEHARFDPVLVGEEWDSKRSILRGDHYGPLTVQSLRALLIRRDGTIEIELSDQETTVGNVSSGIHRPVITQINLPDQPVLDRFQDSIFRMPLNSRVLLLGPPGAGKTTTLIRRLGQKLDTKFLNDDESRLVNSADQGTATDHSRSWIMFAPTKLLKVYVKDAFDREGIFTSDDRIHTWTDFRDNLARNEFRILRSTSGNSSWVMNDSAQTLKMDPLTDPIAWFNDFDRWQKSTYLDRLRTPAKRLSENPAPEIAQLGLKILVALDSPGRTMEPSILASLTTLAGDARDIHRTLRVSSDRIINSELRSQINKNNRFLDEIAIFVAGLSEPNGDSTNQNPNIKEELGRPRVRSSGARDHFLRAVRTQARARAGNRRVSASSTSGRLIAWLGERSLPDEELKEIGKRLLVQLDLKPFINPVRSYINGIPTRYRSFRRVPHAKKLWYTAEGFSSRDAHPLEVDLILLAMIRCTDELIRDTRVFDSASNSAQHPVQRLQRLRLTQVLVDEATDFSPIQLSCMALLARAETRSFFACGDFNQRVTDWGTRSLEQIKWAVPGIEVRTVAIAYRQSRELHNLAKQLADLSHWNDQEAILPDDAELEGVPPVLAIHMSEESRIANWLAHRIQEIKRSIGELPSIAVLLNGEDDVRSVAVALDDALADGNISVVPCPNGRVRDRASAVRVFNVEHIKGLEFEAVFFVGVDRLAETDPNLFDKYLYTGATRAATYFGMTCEQQLPPHITKLEDLFVEDWRQQLP